MAMVIFSDIDDGDDGMVIVRWVMQLQHCNITPTATVTPLKHHLNITVTRLQQL
jgi:hypothetical protein